MPEKMPSREELFKTPEEEQKEKGPIFKFTRMEKDDKGKEIEKEYVSVEGVELEVNKEGEGTQFTEEDFKDFSLDKKSLELLKITTVGIKLDQPTLVEGPTDIGKTRALEYLAYLTNNYLDYINFSGQTDVSELIGKYVPATEDVRIRFEALLSNRKDLKPETQRILKKSDKEGRTLTLDESQEIARNEGLTSPSELEKIQWNWSDGKLPRLMKYDKGRGAWLNFDELGGAEPQILVRINQLFSRGIKRITVSENTQNPTVEAIYPEWHPKAGKPNRFRLIATTNPPSYAGRIPFEKDFIRRWNYKRVNELDEETFLSRLDWVSRKKEITKSSEIDHLINLVISEFAVQGQQKLDSWEWGQGEQEFRFRELSEALRAQDYIRQFQGKDLIEILKDAVRYYYMGKIETNLKFLSKDVGKEEFEKQEQRVKELETLLEEIISGRTGPRISQPDGSKLSIAEAIEKEMRKLDPEIAKKETEKEVNVLEKEFSKDEFLKDVLKE